MDSGKACSTSGSRPGARLEAELEGSLREFVRLRTVSSDPTLREECFRGAKYLATLLESLGTRPWWNAVSSVVCSLVLCTRQVSNLLLLWGWKEVGDTP